MGRFPHRGYSPSTEWHDARRRYEATLGGLAARKSATVVAASRLRASASIAVRAFATVA